MNCPACGYERKPNSIESCPKCGMKLEARKSLGQIEVIQNIKKADGKIVGVYIEQVNGDLLFLSPRSSRDSLCFRARIIKDQTHKLKLILSFKNDTLNPIQIDGYRIEVTRNDKPIHSTGSKNGFPVFHTYGRIINPSEDWQDEEFSWFNAEEWKIIERGIYQIKTKTVYEIDGVNEIVSYPLALDY
ncbi:Uncharacterised protein [uncultured archaeon]|nr:Uncharacterised protein [uncultured archaeon]